MREIDLKCPADFNHNCPEDWDDDYRSIWVQLQVQQHNKMQYRKAWKEVQSELTAARDEAERLQGRVAALEEGLYGIANCAFGYSGCRQTVEEAAIWMNGEAMGLLEGSDGAWLLRKQADAVEEQVRIERKHFDSYAPCLTRMEDRAQRLRQQADEAEQ